MGNRQETKLRHASGRAREAGRRSQMSDGEQAKGGLTTGERRDGETASGRFRQACRLSERRVSLPTQACAAVGYVPGWGGGEEGGDALKYRVAFFGRCQAEQSQEQQSVPVHAARSTTMQARRSGADAACHGIAWDAVPSAVPLDEFSGSIRYGSGAIPASSRAHRDSDPALTHSAWGWWIRPACKTRIYAVQAFSTRRSPAPPPCEPLRPPGAAGRSNPHNTWPAGVVPYPPDARPARHWLVFSFVLRAYVRPLPHPSAWACRQERGLNGNPLANTTAGSDPETQNKRRMTDARGWRNESPAEKLHSPPPRCRTSLAPRMTKQREQTSTQPVAPPSPYSTSS